MIDKKINPMYTLWFDVDNRYKTIIDVAKARAKGCGLMQIIDIKQYISMFDKMVFVVV